jgi:hypothetical protein
MRALAYLMSGRALDIAADADHGIRWPKPELELPPVATTEASAAAWRRWRGRWPVDQAHGDQASGDQRSGADQPKLHGTVGPALQPSRS